MPTTKNPLGQYFTPRPIAKLMVEMLRASKNAKVLEPSCGKGVFLDALRLASFKHIIGVELDPKLAKHKNFKVHNCSFVSWKSKTKFDAVIGNPPYIRWKNLGQKQKLEVMQSPHFGELFNALSDYLMVFIVNAIEHLVPGGELVFITPSFWLHTQHANKVREFMLSAGKITDIVSFGEKQIFPGVASALVIFRFEKGLKSSKPIKYFEYLGGRALDPLNLTLSNRKLFRQTNIAPFKSGRHWTLATQAEQSKASRLEKWAQPKGRFTFSKIGDVCDIANGMVTGLDKAFRITSQMYDTLNSKEKKAVRLVTKAANLSRLATFETFMYIDLPVGRSKTHIKAEYPNLYKHLNQFQKQLEERYDYGRKLPFWEWSFRRSEAFLTNNRQKILVPCKERVTSKPYVRFSLATASSIATQDVTAMSPKVGTRESVEYVCAYLCLDEVTWWIRVFGLIKGGIAEFSERPLSSIPFRSIDWNNRSEVKIHDAITEIVRSTMAADITCEKALKKLRNCFKRLGL
jgi:adenine-specific DNA-methyltransferase